MITAISNAPIKFIDTSINEKTLSQRQTKGCYIQRLPFQQVAKCTDEVNFQLDIDPSDNVGWFIRDKDGTVLFTDATELFVTYNFSHTKAWIGFQWDVVLPGGCDDCVDICFMDINDQDTIDAIGGVLFGSNLALNGDFADGSVWDLNNCPTLAVIAGGFLNCSVSFAVSSSCAEQPITYVDGATYRIGFTVSSFSDLGVGNTHRVITNNAQTNFDDITANGATTFDFVADSSDNKVQYFVDSPDAGNLVRIDIDDVLVRRINTFQEAVDQGLIGFTCSEPISIETTPECTVLLSWYNNEDAFGFDYDSFQSGYMQFMHSVRIVAKLGKPAYAKNKKNFAFSTGDKRLLHSVTDKEFEFFTDHLPEYIHDAISIGIEHDHFFIQDEGKTDQTIEYVSEEEDYEPEWSDDLLLAKVRFNVTKKFPDNKRENNNC